MKKIMVMTLCVMFALGVSTASFAIELSPSQASQVPGSYATVKDGKVVFGKSPAAYSPATLNRILNAYGVTLQAADVPGIKAVTYASVKDGRPAFGNKATAFSPDVFHTVLTAYGNEYGKLYLTLDKAETLKDPPNYVKVKDGKLDFGKKATAYSPEEWNMLLGAYQLPQPGEMPPEVPTTIEPTTEEPSTIEPTVAPPPPGPCPDADADGVCDDMDQCPGTPRGVAVNARGCWIIENLLFDLDKSVIKRKYYPDLDNVVSVLRDNPNMRVEIQGHTCDLGSTRHNQRLSQKRAKAVRTYFMRQGIDPSRLTWVGYGEAHPVVPNTSRENRKLNRRVELHPNP